MKNIRRAGTSVTVLLFASQLCAQQITLLQTADLHGYIYPFDYFRNRPADIGVARVASMVASVRAEGQPVLLFDAGDTIQGSALAYVHQRKEPGPAEPTMLAMNQVGFDAMAVGNHEFNFGLEALERARKDADFPWLAANVVKKKDGTPYFQPYLVKEVAGVRIGVLGLITPAVPTWESPENYSGLEFLDTVETAKRYLPVLRNKENVDAVVIVTHQALELDLESGESNESEYENQVYRLTKEVPGIDVILMGHAHRKFPPRAVNGVVLCEPGRWGDSLCRVDLHFERDPSGGLRLSRWEGDLLKAADFESDEKILELGRPYHERTMAYIDSVVGETVEPLSAERARFRDTALMDLLQRVMLEESGAQLSLAALLPYRFKGIPAGPVTVQQLLSFYPYENTLVVLRVTGREVKEALEHSARYYKTAALDPETGRLEIETDPLVRPYNFDMLAGADYRIDPTRPVGDRIRELSYQGRKMDPDQVFMLVTTNYRSAGGGGFKMLTGKQAVWRSSEEVRNLLIEHVAEEGTIVPVCDFNWYVAPESHPRPVSDDWF